MLIGFQLIATLTKKTSDCASFPLTNEWRTSRCDWTQWTWTWTHQPGRQFWALPALEAPEALCRKWTPQLTVVDLAGVSWESATESPTLMKSVWSPQRAQQQYQQPREWIHKFMKRCIPVRSNLHQIGIRQSNVQAANPQWHSCCPKIGSSVPGSILHWRKPQNLDKLVSFPVSGLGHFFCNNFPFQFQRSAILQAFDYLDDIDLPLHTSAKDIFVLAYYAYLWQVAVPLVSVWSRQLSALLEIPILFSKYSQCGGTLSCPNLWL